MNNQDNAISQRLDLVEEFFTYLGANNYSNETIYNYKSDLFIFNNFLESRSLDVKDFDKHDVIEFKAYLSSTDRKTGFLKENPRQTKLSASSINRCLSAVRAYIRFLIDQDYKIGVVPDQLQMVRRERKHPNVAELHELITLIESPSRLEADELIAARNRAILEVLFSTGMRISELRNLNKRDINNEGKIFITGKGRKQRFVYLTDRAKKYVYDYLTLRQDNQPALFVPTKTRSKDRLNARLTVRYVEGKIQEYREKLKINIPITPHSLRHGFATYLAEEGASPVAIQILLGHESLNTTTRYVNASDRFAEETHNKFHPLPDMEDK